MSVREVFNLIRSGKFEQALPKIELLESVLDKRTMLSFVHFQQGDEKRAFELIEENLAVILSENTSPVETVRCLSVYSFFLVLNGRNEDSLSVVQFARTMLPRVEEFSGSWEYNQLAGDLLNIEGIIFNQMGKSEISVQKYKEALKYREMNHSEIDTAIVQSNLALIYLDQGQFTLALQYIRQAIWIFRDLQLEQPLANAFSTIGHLQTMTRDFDGARFHLEKAIEMFHKLNNPLNLAEAYYRLIKLYVTTGIDSLATDILVEMKVSLKGVKVKLANLYIQLAEAIILKSRTRLVEKARALEILQSLRSIKTEDSSLYIEILFNIADLQLFELTITFNSDLIRELNETLKDISTLANELKSQVIIVKSLIIQAKLFILMNNRDEAEIILKAAYNIAEKSDVKVLLDEINQIRDDQTIILEKWRKLGENYQSMNIVDDKDIKSKIMINLERIEDALRKNQYLQLEQDDFQNIERMKKLLNNNSLFPNVVYKISEYGIDIIWKDFEIDTFQDEFERDTYLTQLGIVFSVIFGQGDQYHSGLFNLPAGKLQDYRVLAYTFRIRDNSAVDHRLNLAYVFFSVFVPTIIADFLPPMSTLERKMDMMTREYPSLEHLDFLTMKKNVLSLINNWVEKIY